MLFPALVMHPILADFCSQVVLFSSSGVRFGSAVTGERGKGVVCAFGAKEGVLELLLAQN